MVIVLSTPPKGRSGFSVVTIDGTMPPNMFEELTVPGLIEYVTVMLERWQEAQSSTLKPTMEAILLRALKEIAKRDGPLGEDDPRDTVGQTQHLRNIIGNMGRLAELAITKAEAEKDG